MHELSIIYNILEITKEYAEKNSLNKIHKITMRIGEFCTLQEDSLLFAFDALQRETLCENAVLVIKKQEAKGYCAHCDLEFKISFMHKLCPICNVFSHHITTGYEILVESIEGEHYETNSY